MKLSFTLFLIVFISWSVRSQNDLCTNATNLPCGTSSLAGSSVGHVNDPGGTGCGMGNVGSWYSFVGNGQSTTIDVTTTSYDIEVAIESGSCGSFTNVACVDVALSSGTESHTFTAVSGVTYYVYVAHWSSGSSTSGSFTISRSCSSAPSTPPNDLCANATSLPCGTSALAGSTVNSSVIASGTGCSMSDYGVWYTFTGNGQVTNIEATTSSYDIEMAIASGSCGSLTNIACVDGTGSLGTESLSLIHI